MSVFKIGRTIAVKFQLFLVDGVTPVSSAVATIAVNKVSDGTPSDVNEDVVSTVPNQGLNFRYDAAAQQYIFNLGTSGWTAGTYRITVSLEDGTTFWVDVGARLLGVRDSTRRAAPDQRAARFVFGHCLHYGGSGRSISRKDSSIWMRTRGSASVFSRSPSAARPQDLASDTGILEISRASCQSEPYSVTRGCSLVLPSLPRIDSRLTPPTDTD